jgi:hypothetical protein
MISSEDFWPESLKVDPGVCSNIEKSPTMHTPPASSLRTSTLSLIYIGRFSQPRSRRCCCGCTATSSIVNYSMQSSTVLSQGDSVIGTTRVRMRESHRLAYLYAIIVDARYRRTWATAYLKFHSLTHLVSTGFDAVAFQALSNNRDILNHARKVGAQRVAGDHSWPYWSTARLQRTGLQEFGPQCVFGLQGLQGPP